MIPKFDLSGVIPPYVGGDARVEKNMSPYLTNVLELGLQLGYTAARAERLRGYLRYRGALRAKGITVGFQWLDGSFVENVEGRDSRDPDDIDVVTFFRRPAGLSDADWLVWANDNKMLFKSSHTKPTYHCDAYPVDLDTSPDNVVRQTRYWFGLFSHRRITQQWKGMLQVPLDANDDPAAMAALEHR